MIKKKGLIIFDIVISIIIILGLCFNTRIRNEKANLRESKFFSENKNLNFDLSVTPEYQKVLAGSTVKIKVDVENIKMGEVRIK